MGKSEGRGRKRKERREEEGGYMCKVIEHIFLIILPIPTSTLIRVKSPVRSHTPYTLHTDHSHFALFAQRNKKRERRRGEERREKKKRVERRWGGDAWESVSGGEGGEEILG